MTSTSLLYSLVFTFLLCIISVASYRLFLHPLAHFPGPKLAAITRLYEAYYDVAKNGQYTFKIAHLHTRYGPIVRISPHELHVNDPSFFEKLYRQEGRWNKYAWSYDAFSAKYSSICTIDHDLHKRRRAPLNAFFSKVTVSNRQGIIENHVNKLCDRVQDFEKSGATLNLGTVISAFTGDVATEYIIGKSYTNLDRRDFNANMTNVLQSSGAMWRITKHIRFLGPTLKALPIPVVEKLGDEGAKAFFAFLKEMMQTTREIMCSRAAQSNCRDTAPTLVHSMLHSEAPPEEKTFDRINDEVGTVLGAALETTAQTLRVILYYVYSNPLMLQRLRAEVATAAKDTGVRQGLPLKTLEQLSYLTAVLMEGLRLSPGLATRMARIAPDRPLVYDTWTIPAGTPVGMTTLLMHTNSEIYPDPHAFNPERWMDVEKRRKADRTFAPFSRGTRICLGMQLAWAELYMTVAALVQRFDLVFEGAGPKDVVCASDQFIIGTQDSSGLKVHVSNAEK